MKKTFNTGEFEIPFDIYSAYLGYINTMIAVTDDKNPYKELTHLIPGEYSEKDLDKWFYQTLAHIAFLNLLKFEQE